MKILLAVDLQKEFMDKDGQYERILAFARSHTGYDRVYATVCKNSPDSPFVKYDNWHSCLDGVMPLEFNADRVFEKYAYGLPDYSLLDKDNEYHIIGFNTDACVLKVALDMFDRGYDIKVLTEYCYSSNGYDHHMNGVVLMQRLMSKAVE